MGWGDSIHPRVDVGRPANDKNESDVSWTLILCLAIMALVLVLAIPMLGFMYMDMHNATAVAVEEIKKMRDLRAKILLQLSEEK